MKMKKNRRRHIILPEITRWLVNPVFLAAVFFAGVFIILYLLRALYFLNIRGCACVLISAQGFMRRILRKMPFICGSSGLGAPAMRLEGLSMSCCLHGCALPLQSFWAQ